MRAYWDWQAGRIELSPAEIELLKTKKTLQEKWNEYTAYRIEIAPGAKTEVKKNGDDLNITVSPADLSGLEQKGEIGPFKTNDTWLIKELSLVKAGSWK